MTSPRLATDPVQDVLSVLAQVRPSPGILTDAYLVGDEVFTVISTIIVCNLRATRGLFRISIAVEGVTDDLSQYLYYDVPINGQDTFAATCGFTMGPSDVLRVQSNTGDLVFSIYGDEITGGA